jgi:lysophospholipase L1-like esterase
VPSRRRRSLAGFLTALLLALGAVSALPSGATAGPKTYVALGDSYAAGPLIPMQEEPWGCLRSTNNYAKLLARRLGLTLRDATCSGAETEDMIASQGVSPEPNPPQFDRLDTRTGLVTLQIGGNDIGFSGIAEECLRAAFEQRSCKSSYVDPATGRDELRRRIDATAPDVAAVIQGIHARSPKADVLVLGYPSIFRVGPGPASCPAMAVGEDDAVYLRGVQEALNDMIRSAAEGNGAEYVDVYGPSAGKTACDLPVLRWVEPLVPVNAAAPIHPNLNGMAGMSDVVEAAVRRHAGSTDLELPPGTPSLPPVTSPF